MNEETTVCMQCLVSLDDECNWRGEWAEVLCPVQTRLQQLMDSANTGLFERRRSIYKLFGNLLDYSYAYQGLEEAVVNYATREAVGKVTLKASVKDGHYTFSPYWIDPLLHLSGFILNVDCDSGLSEVSITTGWASFHVLDSLREHHTYRSHIRMQPGPSPKHMMGDVCILDAEMQIVGLRKDVMYHFVSRSVLNRLLSIASGTAASKWTNSSVGEGETLSKASKKQNTIDEKQKSVIDRVSDNIAN